MDKKIRVAFWHNVFAPYRVPLFQRLAAFDDIDLTVYYGSGKDAYRAWTVNFGEGYHYILLPHVLIPGYPYKLNYTVVSELLRQRYDVHIAVENEIGCQLTYLAARRLKKPFILWSDQINYQIIRDFREYHLLACLKKIRPFLGRFLRSVLFSPFTYGANYVKRHADAYLAAGQKTEEYLRSMGVQPPIFRYGCTIDTGRFAQQLRRQDIPTIKNRLGIANQPVILSVSYLQKRKGIQYLIEAFLQANWPDMVLIIVGDGEYKDALLRLVPGTRSDILFVGHDENTAQYYAIADIFAMPSFSDPWGLTINEAMVAGLPVITTTNVGAQELIQGNGFVIPPRDAQALRVALEQLLNDPQLRHQMGQRSQEIIKGYTIDHTAEVCRQAIQTVFHQWPRRHEENSELK